jgi:deoxyribodipyrimidine photo-lyase
MQICRRLSHNHALNHALDCALRFCKPLVVYEGLKLGYPWASVRLHRFVLEGMLANREAADRLGLNYWPFVETPEQPGRGLLRKLAARATAVVTDDFPCFIIPEQTAALAARTQTPVIAVDGNSVVPLSLLGPAVSAAAHLRPRIHKAFADAWAHRAGRRRIMEHVRRPVDPPFELWRGRDLDAFLAKLPIDQTVTAVPGVPGGSDAARKRLRQFVKKRLPGYAVGRSQPAPRDEGHASGLSPYLHFGHIAIEEIVEQVVSSTGDWITELMET